MKGGKSKKVKRIALMAILLIVLYIPGWFIYTRFCLGKYEMNENKITFKNSVYIRKDYLSASDEENLGKAIGVGISGKRTITDLIWPMWVMEYKNDKDHNRIFVRGLMDTGVVYEKVIK